MSDDWEDKAPITAQLKHLLETHLGHDITLNTAAIRNALLDDRPQ